MAEHKRRLDEAESEEEENTDSAAARRDREGDPLSEAGPVVSPGQDRPLDTDDLVLVEDQQFPASPFDLESVGDRISDFGALSAAENAEEVLEQIDHYTDNQDILDEFADRQRLAFGSDELAEQLREDPLESPEIAAGDIDAGWEWSAVGDELPGGTAPTPDQDVVDELGAAVGLTYEDNEPLGGTDKVERRDDERWELDPASVEADPELAIRFDVDDLDPDNVDEPIVGRGLALAGDLDDDEDDWLFDDDEDLEPYDEELDEIEEQVKKEDGLVP